MARLSVFHMLCPLIDQSSFLGVTNDSQEDCVIVTLGRNIVIRYKIADRKQVGSWSTREKLTSPVIYDPIGCQYVAVFNRNQIRTWKQEDENLDSIKKHKFSEEIQCVLGCADRKMEPIVLLQSGRVCRLSRFLGNKEKLLDVWKQQEKSGLYTVLKTDESIEDWHMISCQTEAYVLLTARSSNFMNQIRFYLLKLSSGGDEEYQVMKHFTLKLPDAHLVGHTVIRQCDKSSLVTLWSSGKIYILSLNTHKNLRNGENIKSKPHPKEEEVDFPGRLIDSVKGLLDVGNVIALAALGSDHIALYGAEPNSTGGVVYIVDIHSSTTGDLPWEALKESAAKQSLTHFNAKDIPPQIWEAAGYLFVPSSDGRLLLASYELGPHPPLADLLGCLMKHSINKKTINNNNNGVINHHQLQHVNWLSTSEQTAKNNITQSSNVKGKAMEEGKSFIDKKETTPEKVLSKLKPLIKQGLPESSICSIILPSLIKEGDIESISWCLSHFHDIPENNLVDLLCFFLNQKPVKTTPKKVEEFTSVASDEKSLNPSAWFKISKDKTSDVFPVQVMMNGGIHEPMDTVDCDSHNEDSEKESFEVGHTFVKGRRRSLRVMKVSTPQKHPLVSKGSNSIKKVGKMENEGMQEMLDMDVGRCSSPTLCVSKKSERRNLSQVLNRVGIVKEGIDADSMCLGELNGVLEDRSSSSNVSCEREGCARRTPLDNSLVKPVDFPSGFTEDERKLRSLALPLEQIEQVGMILSVPVSSMILMPQLRSRLPFPVALKLLKHLIWLLSSPMPSVSSSPPEVQVIHWICHIMDAYFQRFTLSQDVEVQETLQATKEVLDMQLQLIDSLKEITPVILQLQSGKKVEENICDKWYSIENIRLY